MALNITVNDLDRRIWDEELADFVPQQVFDVHTHVYDGRAEFAEGGDKKLGNAQVWAKWPMSDWQMLEEADRLLFPGREVHRLTFGNPLLKSPLDQSNAFTAEQVSNDPKSAGLMVIRPELTADELIGQAEKYGLRGLKPYRCNAVTGDAVECRITDYLPEHQIEAADGLGMIVMLHLSKSKSIADADNLNDLQRLTHAYPNVKWVLAHCARSYYDGPLLKAADRLRTIPNLWYEISSVCDADAMDVLLEIAGPDRVMYGSDDIPVGVMRGKYITFGQAWASLDEENHSLELSHCDGRMTFVRYESLRAFRRAVRRHGYDKDQIEKLFCINAQQLVAGSARNRP